MHCLPQLNPRMFKHGFYDCGDLKNSSIQVSTQSALSDLPIQVFPTIFPSTLHSSTHQEATASLVSH